MSVRVLPLRDDAVLIELADLDEVTALGRSFADEPPPGVVDLVPGARTLMVTFRPSATTAEAVAAAASARDLTGTHASTPRVLEVPTRYDGADLAEVAELLGLSVEEVVRRHTASEFTVGFVGFAPGFAYLTGGDPALHVPRRSSPRTSIPAGSVALAGPYSGVYPRESPGGWQLIGTTDVPMWDLTRERAAFFEPGDLVRFVEASAASAPVAASARPADTSSADTSAADTSPADTSSALEVLAAGLSILVQDLGRHGHLGKGVSVSGALDAPAVRAANRAVGNAADAAVLELVAAGTRFRAHGPQVLAVTGAPVEARVTGPLGIRTPAAGRAFALDDGDELTLGAATSGVRSYLAVRGGIAVPSVLGSRATDVLAGLGPDPVQVGDVLPVGEPPRRAVALDADPAPALPTAGGEPVVLDVVLGPRTDWLSADAVEKLTGQTWRVTPQSNRVGLRLSGDPIERERRDELPSEGCVSGALQIPPNGQPVLFLHDHPLTGGYPVIGAVTSAHVPLAGQLPVGAGVRFRVVRPFAEVRPSPEGAPSTSATDSTSATERPSS